jgi:predicted lipoprotein
MKKHNLLKTGLLLLPVIVISGCNSSGSNSGSVVDSCKNLTTDGFSCEQMLEDIVEHAVVPAVTSFKLKAQALATQTTAYCDALTAGTGEDSALTAAQTAWQESMNVWQQLEVMQFGPLATERDEFYSWPLNDSCKVDEEVVFSLADGYDITTGVTPARRGLDGLEYLLFNSDTGISCGPNNTTAALTAWNAKADDAKLADRCSFAEKVAGDLVTRSLTLESDYAQYNITSASSLQGVADSISDALFYIDKELKDDKLVAVLPLSGSQSFNPDKLEFSFASYAKEAVYNNALGAKAIFTANNHQGLAQYLIAAGQESLATEMLTELDTVISNSSNIAINDTFKEILTDASVNDEQTCINSLSDSAVSDLEKLCALDNDVKAFTDDLKGQFVLTLGFSVPKDAEGDND